MAYASDGRALREVYAALGGDGWAPETRGLWLSSVNHCCWAGIACAVNATRARNGAQEEPRITWLLLQNDPGVRGPLPAALWRLSALQVLAIESCSVTGTIPAEITRLAPTLAVLALDHNHLSGGVPEELYDLTGLQVLLLSANPGLGGTISAKVGQLAALTDLEMSGCGLTGGVPSTMYDLSQLSALYLFDNPLGGTLSSRVGQLQAMDDLEISNCSLTGGVPDGLYDLAGLELLSLSENPSLGGTISPKIGQLRSLQQLDLGDCGLSGGIPDELYDLGGLRLLRLWDNAALGGTISPKVAQLTGMTDLELDNCSLTGGVPEGLFGLRQLYWVALADNPFLGGTISAKIGQLKALRTLELYNCGLRGGIPDELYDAISLERVYLWDNPALGGTISPRIGQLRNVSDLEIANCSLTGGVPSQLYDLTRLVRLYLWQNTKLGGSISSKVGALTAMEDLELDECGLTGALPDELWGLPRLGKLALDDNPALSGTLSPKVAQLQAITVLALHRVGLVGGIPAAVCDIGANITLLDLGENPRLGGSLPDCIGRLSGLATLVVSNTSLAGTLPASLSQLPHLQTLVMSNNPDLGGSVPRGLPASLQALLAGGTRVQLPPDLAALARLQVLSVAGNGISAPFPAEVAQLPMLETLLLAANDFRGSLPPQLSNLTRLRQLDVSYNSRLQGTVPDLSRLSWLRILSLRGCALRGPLPGSVAALKRLSTVCLDLNAFSCGVPATWSAGGASTAFPAINTTSMERRERGAGVGPCDAGELSAVTGNVLECPLGGSVLPLKDVGEEAYACVRAIPHEVWVGLGSVALLVVALAIRAVAWLGYSRAPCGCGAYAASSRAQRIAASVRCRLALVGCGMAAIGAVAALAAAFAPSSLVCKSSWTTSLVGVRFDFGDAGDGDGDGGGGTPSAVLALPAMCAAALVSAVACAGRPRVHAARHTRSGIASRGARGGDGDGDADAYMAHRGSSMDEQALARRRDCRSTVKTWTAAFALTVMTLVMTVAPNALYVWIQTRPEVSSTTKEVSEQAIALINALLQEVALPRAVEWLAALFGHHQAGAGGEAAATRHEWSMRLWSFMGLQVLNAVAVPVLAVLALDRRCLWGAWQSHPTTGVVTAPVRFCTTLDPIKGHCLAWGYSRYPETVTYPSPLSAACPGAIVQHFGPVVALTMLLEGGLFVAVRLLREAARRRLAAAALRGDGGSHFGWGRLAAVATKKGSRVRKRLARWALRWLAGPWDSELEGLYADQLYTLAAAAAWVTVYPPVAWAAAVSLVCNNWAQACMGADEVAFERLQVHAGEALEGVTVGQGAAGEGARSRWLSLRLPFAFHDPRLADKVASAPAEASGDTSLAALPALAPALVCLAMHALLFRSSAFADTAAAWAGPVLPGVAAVAAGALAWWRRHRARQARRRRAAAGAALSVSRLSASRPHVQLAEAREALLPGSAADRA